MDDSFNPYTYNCLFAGNYDGDSVTLDIDLGLKIWKLGEKCRLCGLDTPELKGPLRDFGKLVRDELEKLIKGRVKDGWELYCETSLDKDGMYGRLLVTLHLVKDRNLRIMQAMNVNEWLIDQKYAVIYDGGSKRGIADKHLENWALVSKKEETRHMTV